MNLLETSDTLHLQAAQGWLELGLPTEANEELGNVASEFGTHPAVLRLRWGIHVTAKKWPEALIAAETLIQCAPDDPIGWIGCSYALHEMKRTSKARDILLGVVNKFPVSATIRYNLACYECQLGRLDHAQRWLEKALSLGDAVQMKATAMNDPDLEPLWNEIARLQ